MLELLAPLQILTKGPFAWMGMNSYELMVK